MGFLVFSYVATLINHLEIYSNGLLLSMNLYESYSEINHIKNEIIK